jgi:hypothetical protein
MSTFPRRKEGHLSYILFSINSLPKTARIVPFSKDESRSRGRAEKLWLAAS